MTRARIIALATILAGLGAGTVKFLYGNAPSVAAAMQADTVVGGFGSLEVLDRSQCSVAACNAPACQQAQAVLDDAGQACAVGFVDCSVRIGAKARTLASSAGVTLGPQTYQRVRLIGMRCAVDGGFTYGVPVDDAGWPIYAVTTATPLCVRAPLDGGLDCERDEGDGGSRFIGTGNVFPVAKGVGAQCEAVECTVFSGDDPNATL